MQIGKLDKVVNFYTNTPFATNSGGAVDSYSLFCTTRGKLKKQSGNKSLSFGDIALESSYNLTVRYEALLATYLRVDNIITIDTRAFKLSSIEQDEERRMWYKLSLNERSASSVTFPIGPALNVVTPGNIAEVTITPTVGADFAYSALLAAPNVTILIVAREGTVHYSAISPVGRQFNYVSSEGKIYFDPLIPFGNETVNVLYKVT